MNNHIYCVPRYRFAEEVKSMTEQQFMSGAFICVHDPELDKIIDDAPNVLNLWFHDADPTNDSKTPHWVDDSVMVYFDEIMAQKILKFVQNNLGAKFFLIHCTAGKCRSGAIGEILSEYFDIEYFDFKLNNPQISPNIFVKHILKQTFNYGQV